MSPSSLCPAQPKLLAYRAMNTLDIFRVQDCALLGGERRVDRGLPARVDPRFLPRDVALVDIKSLNLGCGVIVDPQGDESLLRMLIAARWPVLTTGRVVNLDHQADVLSIDNDVVAVTKSALGGANEIVIRHLTRQTAPRYRSRDRAVNRHSRCLWRRCHSDLDHVSGEMDIQLCWRKWRRRAGL